MMKTLKKDVIQSFKKSKGRFFSIMFLVMIGSFTLVGLYVTGPDMRTSAHTYYKELNLADLTVVSDYGLDVNDVTILDEEASNATVEYGYFKDVTLGSGTDSIRIYSNPKTLSKFEIVEGNLPSNTNEVAISSEYQNEYPIGSKVSFYEKADISGKTTLKNHEFKVVGFVKSTEIINAINLGVSTAGDGSLRGYATVTADNFDSDVFMIGRIQYHDTENLDPYSSEYNDLMIERRDALASRFTDRPHERYQSIVGTIENKIEEGERKLNKSKTDYTNAKTQLEDAKMALANASQLLSKKENELKTKITDAQVQIDEGRQAIVKAKIDVNTGLAQLQSSEALLNQKEKEYNQQLASYKDGTALYESSFTKYSSSLTQLQLNRNELESALLNLETCSLSQENQCLNSETLKHDILEQLQSLDSQQKTLNQVKISLDEKNAYLDSVQIQLNQAEVTLNEYRTQLAQSKSILDQSIAMIQVKEQELHESQSMLNAKETGAQNELDAGKATYEANLSIYESKKNEFDNAEPKVLRKLADAELTLRDAAETLKHVDLPTYAVNTRRESIGAEGYRMFGTITSILDSLARIFPLFLYFVAALVTLTTMTRFVDEERINNGTLKALGYTNKEIIKKFVIYGFLASTIGSIMGIVLGHTLIPLIAYYAYADGFTLPRIELHFNLFITLVSIVLGFLSAVVPAYYVAARSLKGKPSQLLQPKAPVNGSKIMLERINFIWNHLSFTHKVTMRNLFRYKKRMFMTIFGVSGSVALLVTGFGIQASISGVGEKQFGNIINYDMIVAANNHVTETQNEEIQTHLTSTSVKNHLEVNYSELYVFAGDNKDKQSITLIVPQNDTALGDYIKLQNRMQNKTINLTDDGIILTEKLATLINANVGDTVEVNRADQSSMKVRVSAITEMYMGHFMFMTKSLYEELNQNNYRTNAYLVTLADGSFQNTQKVSAEFMNLGGVKGVVQNTGLSHQIDTIVESLNVIMIVLIVVAGFLAVVILYNLNNINVAERIRELSTIKVLGFYQKEVTFYIYRETIINSIVGMGVGFGLGTLLHRFIITTVSPDEAMFDQSVPIVSYLVPLMIIVIVSIFLGIVIYRKMKHVNMLEALKSVE